MNRVWILLICKVRKTLIFCMESMTEPKDITPKAIAPGTTQTTRVAYAGVRPLQANGASSSGQTSQPTSRWTLESDPSKSSYAGYLFGSSGTDERPAWSDSSQGRAVIRLFSRGVVGSAFFVGGAHIARKQLAGYESWLSPTNPLQHIARFIDTTVGRGLEKAAFSVTRGSLEEKARAAWDVTNFRTKTFNGPQKYLDADRWGFRRPLNGRSLGAEIVSITFDFFMASIGDATARNVIQSLDPNVKQPWLLDKDGHATTRDKGHFDPLKWGQAVGRSGFRILTKNAGEDWAAALPYAYQMKWQRQALAKGFGGFKLSSDHGWNGGMAAVLMRDDPESGLKKGQINGGYQLAGVLDLQARFTGYNWYTLMYREGYDTVANALDRMRKGTFSVQLPSNPVSAAFDAAGFTARYVMKSFIKATLYMTPAVPLFWLTRTPQSKWRGGFADSDLARATDGSKQSALLTTSPIRNAESGTKQDPVFLENMTDRLFPRARLIHDPRFADGKTIDTVYAGTHSLHVSQTDPKVKTIFNMDHPYHFTGVKRTVFDTILNPFGFMCYKSGSGLTRAVDYVTGGKIDPLTKLMHKGSSNMLLEREKTLRHVVDASFAYTPYMWAKAETALRVDDRKGVGELGYMDKAIYRFIDNAFSFNLKEMGHAASDISNLAVHFEKDVKSREGIDSNADAPDKKTPANMVDTRTIAHHRLQDEAAKQAAQEADPQRRWAENVAGRKLEAQFQPSQTTLH